MAYTRHAEYLLWRQHYVAEYCVADRVTNFKVTALPRLSVSLHSLIFLLFFTREANKIFCATLTAPLGFIVAFGSRRRVSVWSCKQIFLQQIIWKLEWRRIAKVERIFSYLNTNYILASGPYHGQELLLLAKNVFWCQCYNVVCQSGRGQCVEHNKPKKQINWKTKRPLKYLIC